MKGPKATRVKTRKNSMGSPLYYDKAPMRMGRSGGSGAAGNNWAIPNGAKYGLGEGKNPTRMGRSGGSGKSGSGNSLSPCKGPARASRKDTGGNSYMGKTYGVGGVDLKRVGKKASTHGGYFGGGEGVAGGGSGNFGGS